MKHTIFDKEVPGTKFEKFGQKVQTIAFMFFIALFAFVILRLIFPDIVQYVIDNIWIVLAIGFICLCLFARNKKPDRSEMSSKVRHEQTDELERMIEAEKETTIF